MMCTRETDEHVKLSSTDGCTYVSEDLGTIGHVVGSGHKPVNKQSILVSITNTDSIILCTQSLEWKKHVEHTIIMTEIECT